MPLLQRTVLAELLKVFASALSGLTVMLVFVGVIGEATKHGLGPQQVVQILPYVIPSLLPFTIPATLLLTVCVVYGRIAGDLETTAVKAAGISVMSVLWPAVFLGGVLSAATLILTDQFIPWARGQIQATMTQGMEDIFLDVLRTQNQLVDPRSGLTVMVHGVRERTLIRPTFRYRPPSGGAVTVQAQEAQIRFDVPRQVLVLHLSRGYVETTGACLWFDRDEREFPLPQDTRKTIPREMTLASIRREMVEVAQERERMQQLRVLSTALALSTGDFGRFQTPDFSHFAAMIDKHTERYNKLHTELHSRFALSCSCLGFVLLGAPVAVLQARRHFLTSFFLCFVPILAGYYPLVLLCMNLSKSNPAFHPAWTMWLANAVLCLVGGAALRRLLRH